MSATPDKMPATPGNILIADDEESIRWVLERACAKDGHTVHAVASGREALAALRERAYDVALIDIKMPDLSGLDVLTRAREDHVDTLFIIMTAQNTMANAIEATKRGAYDYLTKPFNLDEVELLVGRAMELRHLTRDLERLRGEFEAAAGGTLLLDEIADMPLALQAKLLRVLQEREFTRVGGRDALRADVRIIAASNQDLEAAVRAGRFRDDLFFRLNVVRLTLPPLRGRRGDIPDLIEFCIDKFNRDLGTAIVGVSDDVRELLMRHTWPGNVRELENALLRAAVLARGRTLVPEDFALAGQPRQSSAEVLPLEEAVRHRLAELLEGNAGTPVGEVHATLIRPVDG